MSGRIDQAYKRLPVGAVYGLAMLLSEVQRSHGELKNDIDGAERRLKATLNKLDEASL